MGIIQALNRFLSNEWGGFIVQEGSKLGIAFDFTWC